ncbi:MAG: histidine phosphatase family protein [Eubacteriales bacterium]
MKIYFVRHGETEWNKKRKLQGQSDIPLNEYGRELAQVTRKGQEDIPFDIIFTSPLSRAKETAEILRGNRNISIVEDKRLIELGFGVGEGKSIAAIRRQPEIKLYNFLCKPEEYVPPRGGETFIDLYKRCQSFIDEVIIPSEKKGENKFSPSASVISPLQASEITGLKFETMLVVGHGALIRGMIGCVEDVPLKDFWRVNHKNCSTTIMECVDGQLKMIEEGKIYYEEEIPADW